MVILVNTTVQFLELGCHHIKKNDVPCSKMSVSLPSVKTDKYTLQEKIKCSIGLPG